MLMIFKDRIEAARKLAEALRKYMGEKDVIVLAIPRGGLELGYELAKLLRLPLDTVISKKIPFPGEEEVAIGAVSHEGKVSLYREIIAQAGVPQEYIRQEIERLTKLVAEKYARYREGKPFSELRGKTVILTDDGIATGHTMFAAIEFVKSKGPKKLVVAVPVAPPEVVEKVKKIVDEVVCLYTPSFFMAVGQFYENFRQVSDEEAIEFLKRGSDRPGYSA